MNQTLFAHSEAHFKSFSSVFLSYLERAAYTLQPTLSPSLFLILTMVMSGVSAAAGLLPRTYTNFIIIEEVDSDAIERTQRDDSCYQQCWAALVIMNISSAVSLRFTAAYNIPWGPAGPGLGTRPAVAVGTRRTPGAKDRRRKAAQRMSTENISKRRSVNR